VTPDAAPGCTLVLGVGNPLMSDDGVGLRLLEALRRSSTSDGVEFLDAGTLSLILLPRIAQCRCLLVLDAARLGSPPGAVRVLHGADMDDFLRESSGSVHEVSLRDLLDAARLTESLPKRRALVGVQPGHVGWGEALSEAVEAAVPAAVAQSREVLAGWARDRSG